MLPPSFPRPSLSGDKGWKDRGPPPGPGEARPGLREQPIISNSNTWQEEDLMGPMSHFYPRRPVMSRPAPLAAQPRSRYEDIAAG